MPDHPPLILLVEDDEPIRRFVRAAMTSQGHRVMEVATGAAALEQAVLEPPDLVLLDLGLPDIDGLEVIDRLRDWTQLPVIVLSARDREADRVEALDRGADDFLSKPFGAAEMLARVRAALRRASRRASDRGEPAELRFGRLRIDLGARRVWLADQELKFTRIEYRLLTTLARHGGRVLTHGFLLREVWGPRHVDDPRYVRVFVSNLRQKVERDPSRPELIITEQGVGYRFAEPSRES
ncbi:MAG: response regulator [Planctomycetes bacterium]|nr:response regulator [Planctomycetota bacterium]